MKKYQSSLFILSAVLLFSVSSTNLAFADIDTDKSTYSAGELITVSGTLLLESGDEPLNIVGIEIIDSDNNTVVSAFTPVNDDNTFEGQYETGGWAAGDYTVAISYDGTDESADFEIDSSLSSENEEATTIENEEATTIENEEATTIENEEATTIENEEATTIENEEATTIENEEATTIENEEATTIENEEATTIENEEATTIENEEATTIENEEATTIENEEATTIENEEATTIENEEDTLTTSTSGAATPNPPVNLQATQISQNRINLSWSAPTDSGESPLVGYKIESKTSDESDYAILVTNTGSTSITTYSHTGLTAGLTYDYRISAINSAGESNPSDVVTATIEMTGGNEQEGSDLSQRPQAADPLQPVQVTLSTDKSSYGPNDSITISGTTDSSSQTIPLGMRVVSPDGAIVYVRSISIDSDGSFETVIPSTQRQSSTWESDGEYTVEVTQNGRIQATAAFANDSSSSLTPGADDLTDPTTTPADDLTDPTTTPADDLTDPTTTPADDLTDPTTTPADDLTDPTTTPADDLTDPTTTPADQQQSPPIASPPVPGVNPPGSETPSLSGDDLETLTAQNTALESANQQLQDENNELKTQIDDLNSQLEQLDLIVKEQMRVMLETLGIS